MGCRKAVPAAAQARNMFYLDATCPLVSKVHVEARAHHAEGPGDRADRPCRPPRGDRHAGPAAGRRGDADRDCRRTLAASSRATPSGSPTSRRPPSPSTTPPPLSPSSRSAFPAIVGPRKEDICYATTNRQAAVKAIAPRCDALIVVGAPNSSNSLRLVEVARTGRLPQGAAGAARRRHPVGGVRRHRHARHHRRRFGAGAAGDRDHRRLPRTLRWSRSRAWSPPRSASPSTCRASCARRRGLSRSKQARRRMAVYTEVSDEELARFIASYGLGALLSYKGIAEGVENTNYLVHTEKGPFFLTLYEKRVDPDRSAVLPRTDGASGQGRASPVRRPCATRRGACCARWPDGRPRSSPSWKACGSGGRSPSHCLAVGEALARLHLAGRGFCHAARQRAWVWPAGARSTSASGSAPTRSRPVSAAPSSRSSTIWKRTGQAAWSRASSTPTCFPTTCSSSATSSPA